MKTSEFIKYFEGEGLIVQPQTCKEHTPYWKKKYLFKSKTLH